jgi:hypothetical protein
MLSYAVDDFFSCQITVLCAVPDEVLPKFQEEFKTFIKA